MARLKGRKKRQRRIRGKIVGTPERPRLCVTKSHKGLFLQIVDDLEGKTLFGIGTDADEFAKKYSAKGNVSQAEKFGEFFGAKAVEKGFSKVVFDRSGFQYHGRMKTLAEALRKAGMSF